MLTSVHLSYILGTLPLEERFVAARKMGFSAVEFPFPYEMEAQQYARLLKENGLRQISIGAPACNYRAGEPGFSITPSMKEQFDRSIDTVIPYAKAIDCRSVHIFSGAKSPDVSDELAFDTYCERIAEAHDRLQAEGLGVVIEPVNSIDFKGYFFNRLDLVLRVLERVKRDNVKIILDVYHAHVHGEDPTAFLARHADKVAHIQLADYPGRHEPGSATIDFARFFETLHSSGYTGSIGLEYVPTRPIFEGIPLAKELNLA